MNHPVPTLRGPDDGNMRSQGTGSSGDHAESTATIETGMALEALAAHFDEQLREQGWQAVSRLADDDTALRTYRRDADRPWSGMLIITTVPNRSTRHLIFRMTAQDAR
jgi:hypothetical protein